MGKFFLATTTKKITNNITKTTKNKVPTLEKKSKKITMQCHLPLVLKFVLKIRASTSTWQGQREVP
jgi:hypothetical protein